MTSKVIDIEQPSENKIEAFPDSNINRFTWVFLKRAFHHSN